MCTVVIVMDGILCEMPKEPHFAFKKKVVWNVVISLYLVVILFRIGSILLKSHFYICLIHIWKDVKFINILYF